METELYVAKATCQVRQFGQQVLYVEVTGLEKPDLLTGDLYHFEENRTKKGVPSSNFDAKPSCRKYGEIR